MDAPKCQFCGKREWRHVCASISGEGSDVTQRSGSESKGSNKGQVGKAEVHVGKKPFDRKTYQREYMRRYREYRKVVKV